MRIYKLKNLISQLIFYFRTVRYRGTGRKFARAFAKKIASVQPMRCEEAIKFLFEYGERMLQPGNFGHEFLQGDFIVNDKKKPIYRDKDEQYYIYLMKQYGHEDKIRMYEK